MFIRTKYVTEWWGVVVGDGVSRMRMVRHADGWDFTILGAERLDGLD